MEKLEIKEDLYAPIIITDGHNNLNINEQGIFEKLQDCNDQYLIIQDKKYIELIKQNKFIIEGVEFRITDNVWDFTSNCPDYNMNLKPKLKYIFPENCSDYYITLIKLFTLESILINGIYRPMVHTDFLNVIKFIKFLKDEEIKNLNFMSTLFIDKFFQDSKTETYKQNIKISLNKFFKFYWKAVGQTYNKDIINYLDKINVQKISDERENGKLSLLPQTFMKPFVNLLMDILKDESKPIKERKAAGILLICTQTGIRSEECLIIPYNCLNVVTFDGIDYHEFIYNSTKPVIGLGYTVEKTFANKVTCEAVEILQSFDETKYLGNLGYFTLNHQLEKIISNNAEKLNCISYDEPLEGFDGTPIIEKLPDGRTKYINMPIIKQFRVYVSSELERRGYNEYAILALLNQKDEKMLGYYSRPVASLEKDKLYKQIFLQDLLEDDLKIIGQRGDEYTNRINSFLKKNKQLNIHDDIDEIFDEVNKMMPMKVIPGGFCICPAPQFTCSAQSKGNVDSIYCAYGMCKNQSHLYYDLPYHYSQFEALKTSVKHNLENEYINEAEKELYKLQYIVKTLIEPEISELEELISKKGQDYVLNKHPELENILNSLNEIKGDIEVWKNKEAEQLQTAN